MSSLFRRGASQQSMPTFTPPTHLPSGSGRSISSFSRHTRVPSKATSLTYLLNFSNNSAILSFYSPIASNYGSSRYYYNRGFYNCYFSDSI